MSGKDILGILSMLLAVVGYGVYVRSIFLGRTKPHMFSWIVWGTVSGVASLAQIAKHGGAGSWATGESAFVCYAIAGIAAFRGEKNITRSDWVFFIAALAALPLWYATHEPLWSVLLVVVIDGLGFYPTFRKSWSKPFEEATLMFALDGGKFIVSLMALEAYSWAAVLYPSTALILNTIFIGMVLYRRAALTK